MKNLLLSAFIVACSYCFGQQPQGEYHKHIVKKTDDERKKTKGKEWWGAGVIMFSNEDIPREGKIKETESMLKASFKDGEKFVGRVYLPRAVSKMDQEYPQSLEYRLYVDGKGSPYRIGVRKEVMPEGGWSSWLLDFPDNFENAMKGIDAGEHKIRIEVWSSREVEVTTVYTDENNKPLAYSKENDNKGKFWAAGDFNYTK